MSTKVEKLEFEGSQYEVIPPLPTSTERGGIIASAKTSDYTTEVKLGSDGKLYVPKGGGVDSLSDLGITATATELNYVDGVTSNVQTQLNEKAWLSQAIANEGHTGQGETFDKNFLCIDLSNRLSTTNQRAYWYKPDDTGWNNVPPGLKGLALGIREVFYYDKDHILVKITEFVPVQGRTWVNVYDYGWRGWKCYTDMSRGTLSSTANIDELSCGTYWCNLTSSNGGTIPVADYGVLEVMSNEDSIGIGNLQRFTTYSNGNKVYVRLRANGTWSSWKLLAVGDFLPLSGGDLTGELNINGNSNYFGFYDNNNVRRLALWVDNEGGNIRITPPAAYSHYWEIDAYNGNLRVRDSSGNNTYTFNSYANGGRGGTIGGSVGSWQTWTSGTLLTNYSDISIRVRVDSDARPSGTYVVVNIPTAMLSTATAQDDYFSMTVVTQGGTWEDNCFWGTLYVKVNAANNGITVTIDGLAHRLNGSPIIKVR